MDARSGEHLNSGLLDIRNTLWSNIASNLAETANAQVLFTNANRNNILTNPGLRSISRATNGLLDPRPTVIRMPPPIGPCPPPPDRFYTPANYYGAFDDNDLWLASWTALDHHGFLPRRNANTIQVTNHISGTNYWSQTNEYVLNGLIYVLRGGVLHIEAGTVIKGKGGAGPNTSALIVTIGGKIFANGTANNPIIFTGIGDNVFDPTDLPIFQRGLWGGVALSGKAVLNTSTSAEGNSASPKYDVLGRDAGLPDAFVNGQYVHRFGGNDDNDSSGVMRYCSVRHAGMVHMVFRPLSGLSVGAVGRNTILEFVETYACADDGFEWFGGTVNSKYLVSAFNDDDAFDIDQGYRGRGQFWFSIQEPGRKDHGGEWNGEPNGLAVSNSPVARFQVENMTMIGAGMTTTNNSALFIRDYAAPRMYNSIITDFGGHGVRMDDRSGAHLASGLLDIRDNIWFNFSSNLAETANAQILFADSARNNDYVDPQLRAISRQPNGLLDRRPRPGSPAFTGTGYIGAFGDINWAAHWTALGELGLISTTDATAPPPDPLVVDLACVFWGPTLSIARGTDTVTISWRADCACKYQLQSTTNLGAPWWDYEGAPITGTGEEVSVIVSTGGGQKFFRVQSVYRQSL